MNEPCHHHPPPHSFREYWLPLALLIEPPPTTTTTRTQCSHLASTPLYNKASSSCPHTSPSLASIDCLPEHFHVLYLCLQ